MLVLKTAVIQKRNAIIDNNRRGCPIESLTIQLNVRGSSPKENVWCAEPYTPINTTTTTRVHSATSLNVASLVVLARLLLAVFQTRRRTTSVFVVFRLLPPEQQQQQQRDSLLPRPRLHPPHAVLLLNRHHDVDVMSCWPRSTGN